jgi:NAD(P)H-dependent FMN reductase
MRSLIALRQVLELGCGAMVLPEQVVVREAAKAFDDNDDLVDHRASALLKSVVRRLIDMTRQMT